MSVVTASITISAPKRQVWQVVMDPSRLGEWVTIHRRLVRADDGTPKEGFQMEQLVHLRGVNLPVRWRLVACKPCELAVWEGRGPARSRARTEYHIADDGHGGTRFDYRNEFYAPLGPVGALASRAIVGGVPGRQAELTLRRLRSLLERARSPAPDNHSKHAVEPGDSA